MARLMLGQRDDRQHAIFYKVVMGNGILESEIASDLNLDRRTVNNYLRRLKHESKVYKDGWYWYKM